MQNSEESGGRKEDNTDPYEDFTLYGSYNYGENYSGECDRYLLAGIGLLIFLFAWIVVTLVRIVLELMKIFGWI